jgi:hypothetical protein
MQHHAITAFLLVTLFTYSAALSCMDEGGEEVEWWLIYSLPHGLTDGDMNYLYLDEGSSVGFEMVKKILHESESETALDNTLSLRKTDKKVKHIYYNDHPPGQSTKNSYAHAKGAIYWKDGDDKFIWITHSQPEFPQWETDSYIRSENPGVNGQHFFCLSLPQDAFDPLLAVFNRDHVAVFSNDEFEAKEADTSKEATMIKYGKDIPGIGFVNIVGQSKQDKQSEEPMDIDDEKGLKNAEKLVDFWIDLQAELIKAKTVKGDETLFSSTWWISFLRFVVLNQTFFLLNNVTLILNRGFPQLTL